ncbi:hypothetical protein C8R43DRAFT_1202715 [Mycena crocata]|nr:hypothetical protein C8R43DRAFT_1202715 [Mycena crocata]
MTNMQFSCDGCSKNIPPNNPRVRCVDCEDYDMCTNCAIGERFSGAHTVAHRTRIFKISGGGRQVSIPCSTAIVYGSDGAPSIAATVPEPVYNPPPPLPPRQANSSLDNANIHPTLMATGWGPFFNADMSPTPVFSTLMYAIMNYLDTGHTGHLVPEAFSKFLDDQGYPLDGNTWKSNLVQRSRKAKEDVADAALRRVCDLYSIEYILQPRPRNSDDLAGQLQGMSVSGGTMPLMTLKGFMDITTIEMLCDPSAEWGNISRAIRMYDLPAVRGWGDVPRSVLPDAPDARMEAKVAQVSVVSREQAQRRVEASRVRLQLRAQGEQNAMDLLDDRRYYYTYR